MNLPQFKVKQCIGQFIRLCTVLYFVIIYFVILRLLENGSCQSGNSEISKPAKANTTPIAIGLVNCSCRISTEPHKVMTGFKYM